MTNRLFQQKFVNTSNFHTKYFSMKNCRFLVLHINHGTDKERLVLTKTQIQTNIGLVVVHFPCKWDFGLPGKQLFVLERKTDWNTVEAIRHKSESGQVT